jgi:hypothetical protein
MSDSLWSQEAYNIINGIKLIYKQVKDNLVLKVR